MFVRHGEKPAHGSPPHGVNHHGEPDEQSVSVRGWTRAGALAGLFAHAPAKSHPHIVQPGRVFATRPTHEAKSKREKYTATPVAERLKVHVMDSYAHGDEKDLPEHRAGIGLAAHPAAGLRRAQRGDHRVGGNRAEVGDQQGVLDGLP